MSDEETKENTGRGGGSIKEENEHENTKEHESEHKNGEGGELEQCARERSEYLAGWQRAKADFINYKKEDLRRLEEVAKFGSEDLIEDIVSVVYSFDLALRVMEKNGGVDKGFYLIRSQIEDVLKKRGLEKMHISPGDAYDPSLAEAMLEIESDKPPGTVIEVMEPGYLLHGEVLKPAKVALAKSKANNN